MRRRRVKLIWGASQVIRGRWHAGLWGFYERVPGDSSSGLAISLRGVLAWGALFAGGLYVAGATAVFWIWRQNSHSQLTYTDALFYPWRRAEISRKKGRAFITQGTELFRAGKYADAANLLRLGLARHPTDLNARLQLAQFYLMANQRPLAGQVLDEGLRETYPGRPYLETLFGIREQAEDYAGIVTIARRYRPPLTGEAADRDRRWLQEREFGALLADGRAGEALALAETIPPGDTQLEQRVLALLALKRPAEALAALEAGQRTPGPDQRIIRRLRVRAFREAGQLDAMEAALAEMHALFPMEPALAVFGIVQQVLAGRLAAADRALTDYLFRFGGSVENLLLVTEPLAEQKSLSLVQRCVAAAAERGYPLPRFHSLLVQAYMAHGQWTAAGALLAKLPEPTGRDAVATRVWREWMQRLLDAADATTDSAQLALLEFLRSRPWPLRMFRTSIDALLSAGRHQTARDTVAIGLRGFPGNPWLTQMAENVRPRLEPSPPAGTDATLGARMLVERLFFERLDALVRERQWADAEQLIREVRAARPAPAWLDQREPDLWLVQIQACQARGDLGGTMTAVRMYLPARHGSADRLLEIARGFHARGDRETSIAILKEVRRRFPANAAAEQQLAEWQPPAP